MIDLKPIKDFDIEIYDAMKKELSRQRGNLELIASENFVSQNVLAVMGSHLTNKYAEGYPKKRYYGGCINVDTVEQLAIDRAKTLFGAEHANVQPHCGSSANFGVYFAMLNLGDTILGMDLSHGGHLTHGSPVNMSGKYFKFISYGVTKERGEIDYNALEEIALKEKPKMIVAGASAYSRIIDFKKFREIADKVSAYLLVDMAHIAGLVISGDHPSPVPHADFVTTTTHKTLRGPRGGMILCKEKYAKQIDKAIFPGIQGGPLEHIIAAKAVAFKEAMSDEFKTYQHQVVKNAKAMASRFMKNGLNVVSGGTDNHLLLLDLRSVNITGKELEFMLDEVNITVNKNTVPFETTSPFITSGIRIGTPSVTTRGMKEREMEEIADMICEIVKCKDDAFAKVRENVSNLCKRFPLYENDILM